MRLPSVFLVVSAALAVGAVSDLNRTITKDIKAINQQLGNVNKLMVGFSNTDGTVFQAYQIGAAVFTLAAAVDATTDDVNNLSTFSASDSDAYLTMVVGMRNAVILAVNQSIAKMAGFSKIIPLSIAKIFVPKFIQGLDDLSEAFVNQPPAGGPKTRAQNAAKDFHNIYAKSLQAYS